MRVFKKSADEKYTLEWHNRRGQEYRWLAYRTRKASIAVGLQLERLAACIASGEPISDSLAAWAAELKPAWRRKLTEAGLLGQMMPFVERVAEYRDSLIAQQRTSGHVTKTVQLLEGVHKAVGLDDWGLLPVAEIERLLASKPRKPSTVFKYVHQLRSFGRWQMVRGYTSANPAMRLQAPRIPTEQGRQALTEDEQEALLGAVARTGRVCATGPVFRYHVYLLALHAGLRAGEIGVLTPGAFDWERNAIHLAGAQTKGRRFAWQPLSAATATIMRKYIADRSSSKPIFGRLIEPARWVKKDGKTAGINIKGLTLHSLRHSYATNLVRANVRLDVVQRLMRHQNIKTTMRYVHMVPADLYAAIGTLPNSPAAPLDVPEAVCRTKHA